MYTYYMFVNHFQYSLQLHGFTTRFFFFYYVYVIAGQVHNQY